MKTTTMLALAAMTLAPAAMAQQTITNGAASFSLTGITASATPWNSTTLNQSANLLPDGSTPDWQTSLNWGFRSSVSNLVNHFGSTNGLGSGAVVTIAGDTASYNWTNAGPGAAGIARVDANLSLRLVDLPGARTARLIQTFVLTARPENTSAQTFTIVNAADMDVLGTFAGNVGSVQSGGVPGSITLQQQLGIDVATLSSPNATAYEIGLFGTVMPKSRSSGTPLNNTPAGAGTVTGDLAMALSWTVTLNPGESVTLTSVIETVPTPGTAMILGMAGLAAARRRRA